jgi:hypothetical protein
MHIDDLETVTDYSNNLLTNHEGDLTDEFVAGVTIMAEMKANKLKLARARKEANKTWQFWK